VGEVAANRAHTPSIRDVARLAQVSHQSVSRVLNGRPNVSDETRRRVLDAIEALNYRPNRAARALALRRSQMIGVLPSGQRFLYGPSSAVRAIEDTARLEGYSTLVANASDESTAALTQAMEHLFDEGVEGIIVIAPQPHTAEIVTSMGVPVPVLTLQSGKESQELGIGTDNYFGSELAVRHLVALGHTRVALLQGPSGWSEAIARTRGTLDATHAAGLTLLGSTEGDWTAESGYRNAAPLLATSPTAIISANDQMALGLLHAISEAGLRVPEDISVVGFDDVPEAAHYLPPLTTLRQDFHEIGHRAIAALLARMRGGNIAFHTPLRPELIIRGSTAPPPAAAAVPAAAVPAVGVGATGGFSAHQAAESGTMNR
jgi:DNA-binding LacI/PurR family transcriptional regulator